MAHVLLSIPHEGWIHKSVFAATIQMYKDTCGHTLSVTARHDKPIENSRNHTVNEFLAGSYDYLFFMDSDNPPVRNPLPLVDLDKDIMVLPTPMWNHLQDPKLGGFPVMWNCLYEGKAVDGEFIGWAEFQDRNGLQEISVGGSGAMIIARRVFDRVRPAFERTWNEDGTCDIGSDFYFCKKARDAGFKVFAHYDYPCDHYKEKNLTSLYTMFMQRDISTYVDVNPNTPEYWDAKIDSEAPGLERFYKDVVNWIGGGTVLDFGCGRGELLSLLGSGCKGIDFSPRAVEICKEKGLAVDLGSHPEGRWDTITALNVLPMVDDDAGLLEELFRHTNRIFYSVPFNCLPPAVKPENRRVYTANRIEKITPDLKKMVMYGDYALIEAERST